jgi:hypothetical protein
MIAECNFLLSIRMSIGFLVFMMEPTAWAQEHFGNVDLGDTRRTARLVRMAASAAASPAGTVTEVFTRDAERQGAYDLLESKHVDAEALEAGVGQVVGARCGREEHIHVVIDGSNLSFSDFYGKRRLGKIGNYRADGAGLKVMSALALDTAGVPLGLLRQVMWSRPRKRPTNRRPHAERPVHLKETWHWLDAIRTSAERVSPAATKLTYVLDREADTDDVIRTLAGTGHQFVLRSRNRLNHAKGRVARLREQLAREPILGTYELQVAARPGRPPRAARAATVTVRTIDAVLRLKVGGSNKERTELQVSVVVARESGPGPRGDDRIDWLLITNRRVVTFDDARAVVATYMLRWRIEEFHKTWKSGHCRVEQSQLRGEQAVRKWALILAAVACRVERLKLLARTTPEMPADAEFSELELHALLLLKRVSTSHLTTAETMPTISQATTWVAEIGGYTGRSSGGPPGSITLSRGLFKLRAAADAIAAYLAQRKR